MLLQSRDYLTLSVAKLKIYSTPYWIDSADGEDLHRAHDHILKAYQIADYPETVGGKEEIERDDDYRGEDPSPRETDQDRYGYQGDR